MCKALLFFFSVKNGVSPKKVEHVMVSKIEVLVLVPVPYPSCFANKLRFFFVLAPKMVWKTAHFVSATSGVIRRGCERALGFLCYV